MTNQMRMPGPSLHRLAAGHLLDVLRVASAFNLDLRGGVFDFAQVVARKLNVGATNVLFQSV